MEKFLNEILLNWNSETSDDQLIKVDKYQLNGFNQFKEELGISEEIEDEKMYIHKFWKIHQKTNLVGENSICTDFQALALIAILLIKDNVPASEYYTIQWPTHYKGTHYLNTVPCLDRDYEVSYDPDDIILDSVSIGQAVIGILSNADTKFWNNLYNGENNPENNNLLILFFTIYGFARKYKWTIEQILNLPSIFNR